MQRNPWNNRRYRKCLCTYGNSFLQKKKRPVKDLIERKPKIFFELWKGCPTKSKSMKI